jgi:ATP-binding cassette subfamily G (WHITE) protein 2
MCVLFGNVVEIGLFFDHRALFFHEVVSGYYRVSAYFISKIMVDVVSVRLVPLLIFAVISYYMMGYQSDFDKFAFFALILILEALSSASFAFLFSALFSHKAVAMVFLSFSYVLMMAFGGLLVNLKAMSDIFSWMRYLSAFYYAAEAIEINELKDQLFCSDAVKANNSNMCPYPVSLSSSLTASGNQYLHHQGFHSGDKWRNPAILAGMTVVVLMISYLKFLFMRKTR